MQGGGSTLNENTTPRGEAATATATGVKRVGSRRNRFDVHAPPRNSAVTMSPQFLEMHPKNTGRPVETS